jgi:sugar phosphate isomerase/epimerase
MQLTGFSDEASRDLGKQIQATRELGWRNISARMIGDRNIHELTDSQFERVADQLDEAGIHVPEFGSLIGNWAKSITGDFRITIAEVDRAIPRMKRLGTKIIRVMSYAQRPWGERQYEEERFRRLRHIVQRFSDAGLVAAHENCMNWGGFSPSHTLRLIEEVPGLKLIFDTGNPIFQRDRSKPEPFPWQNSFEFWKAVRDHVVHIHIKDCRYPVGNAIEPVYTMPGEGDAAIREILKDAWARGYRGYLAIEPHVATVFHASDQSRVHEEQCYNSYVEYGRRMEALLESIGCGEVQPVA